MIHVQQLRELDIPLSVVKLTPLTESEVTEMPTNLLKDDTLLTPYCRVSTSSIGLYRYADGLNWKMSA